ncbi:ribosomal protein L18P/L5E [Methanosalsum zhilinae DSM 4017]|uniref:Large ribosomal subunit protein uL18 n=1 Tax=Methanosalsum zhilinae (strain DSM 4017 / NBRC 107636 / OCM 62 / WeN5) TaxID=679901 RepID=F7XMP5_METZD|nr:50S ribosomal protein L18 [Methanosalsum zhilinae]AEH61064.1 ribosomal protein L18P/L5E [Methanosalsum zhilinae DSM 4017]
MATGPRYKVAFRRRREGRTNYHQRLKLILSKQNRVVVRKSSKHIQIQLVNSRLEGDVTLSSAVSTELNKYGYEGSTGNTTAAYLTGLLFGYKALKEGYDSGILDIGLQASSKGSRVYAALKGTVDAGLDIPHNPEIFPSDDRIKGEHVDEYIEGSNLSEQFEAAREKILSDFN